MNSNNIIKHSGPKFGIFGTFGPSSLKMKFSRKCFNYYKNFENFRY